MRKPKLLFNPFQSLNHDWILRTHLLNKPGLIVQHLPQRIDRSSNALQIFVLGHLRPGQLEKAVHIFEAFFHRGRKTLNCHAVFLHKVILSHFQKLRQILLRNQLLLPQEFYNRVSTSGANFPPVQSQARDNPALPIFDYLFTNIALRYGHGKCIIFRQTKMSKSVCLPLPSPATPRFVDTVFSPP